MLSLAFYPLNHSSIRQIGFNSLLISLSSYINQAQIRISCLYEYKWWQFYEAGVKRYSRDPWGKIILWCILLFFLTYLLNWTNFMRNHTFIYFNERTKHEEKYERVQQKLYKMQHFFLVFPMFEKISPIFRIVESLRYIITYFKSSCGFEVLCSECSADFLKIKLNIITYIREAAKKVLF